MKLTNLIKGRFTAISRRLSQILLTNENLCEGIQKEKLNQRVIDKIEKGDKTKQLLEGCESRGDPFTTVKELEHTIHR